MHPRGPRPGHRISDPAIVTVYPVPHPRGVLATSGGWAYCLQMRPWRGASTTRSSAAGTTSTATRATGSALGATSTGATRPTSRAWRRGSRQSTRASVAISSSLGVSYSGFGVATLASHHPELRPDRLIVIDSFLDLPARRAAAGPTAPVRRSTPPRADRRRRSGTDRERRRPRRARPDGHELTVIWSISPDERGSSTERHATRTPTPECSARLRPRSDSPVSGWVTESRHGHDLWDSGRRILAARPPGREVLFRPGGARPAGSTC